MLPGGKSHFSENPLWPGFAGKHRRLALLDADDHRIRTDKVFDARFAETRCFHPTDAISAGVIETALGFD